MAADILKPFGDYETPGACEAVVDLLRGMLEMAEAGEIIGLSYAFVRPNGTCGFGYKAGTGNSLVLIGAASLAHHMLAEDLNSVPDAVSPSAS